MTTISPVSMTCSICGAVVKTYITNSTCCLWAADLDGRPAPMARTAMFGLLVSCSECGYAGYSIEDATEIAKETVASKDYQQIRHGNDIGHTSVLLRIALIDERQGDIASAAQAYLHAAWACERDDEINDRSASLRARSAALFERCAGRAAKTLESKDRDGIMLVRLDNLRRIGAFERFWPLAREARSAIDAGSAKAVLRFQEELAEKKDQLRYTFDDVPGYHDLREAEWEAEWENAEVFVYDGETLTKDKKE